MHGCGLAWETTGSALRALAPLFLAVAVEFMFRLSSFLSNLSEPEVAVLEAYRAHVAERAALGIPRCRCRSNRPPNWWPC